MTVFPLANRTRLLTRPGLERDVAQVAQQIREGRFQRGLSLIAGLASLLSGFEAAEEHYRAGYGLQIMYTPVLISPLLLIAGLWGVFSRRAARTLLPIASILTLIDGLAGFYFHIRNIARRPGGWRLPIVNVVMGPPLFAPVLFGLSGYLGLVASLLRRADEPSAPLPGAAWLHLVPTGRELLSLEQDVREGRFQQQLAAVAAATALLSGVESAYLHYKNAFLSRMEWTPVLVSPLVVAAGLGTIRSRTVARTVLPLASLLAIADGTLGFYFHVRGMLRRPGGLRNGLYNLLYGPPPFAPLLLAAAGFMGLVASFLRRAG
ncbi:MAG TPA: hypothetical protein VFB58_11095 [Chloroflexota bacterium]|nr:hypothetical protein [Chloroflexota bacterium]